MHRHYPQPQIRQSATRPRRRHDGICG